MLGGDYNDREVKINGVFADSILFVCIDVFSAERSCSNRAQQAGSLV